MKYDVNIMKYEYKYMVPNELLSELRTRISPFVEKDSYMDMGSINGYTVRSIYFDTPNLDFYHDKIAGLKIRKKFRIRGYNDYNHENVVFLEIKRKNEKKIYKHRAAVKFMDLHDLLATGDVEKYILLDHGLKSALDSSRRFLFHIHTSILQPNVLVIYEREAFFGKFDRSLRITFDKNLRSSMHPELLGLFKEENIKYVLHNYFILEVKFYHEFPSWMKPIIASLGFELSAFSKYTNCIDKHMVVHNNSRLFPHNFTCKKLTMN